MKKLALTLIPLNMIMILYLIYPVIRLEMRKKALPRSVVKVSDEMGTGTGGIISYKGQRYVLSNSHVCHKKSYKTISFDGLRVGKLKVLRRDPERDLCLLEAPDGLKALRLAQEYHLGERIVSGGYPKAQGPVVVTGILFYEDFVEILAGITIPGERCPRGTIRDRSLPFLCFWQGDLIISTMFVAPGQSGSPVVNMDGELVAVVVASQGGFGALIPLETVREFLDQK